MSDISLILVDASMCELEGNLLSSLKKNVEAKENSTNIYINEIIDTNLDRLKLRIKNKSKYFFNEMPVEVLYEHKKNPTSYKDDISGLPSDNYPPIISLTTISTRIERLSETINCLLNQDILPHSINIYISEEPKLLDEGISRDNKYLEELYHLGANIYIVENIGPYRKQYPVLKQLHSVGAPGETPIITVDDDIYYPSNFIKKIKSYTLKYPQSVISHRGRKITIDGGKIASYKQFTVPDKINDLLNLGTGKNGILYKLNFFTKFQDLFVGPIIAPAADDLWCKWITGIQGIKTVIYEPLAVLDDSFDFNESDPDDENSLYKKINKSGGNDLAIELLEKYLLLNNLSFNNFLKNSQR